MDLCIRCNKSGKLLVCSDSGCPISVHEECMGCPARFDDTGNFYCPYCMYKQAITQSHKAREVVSAKKKALSTFINEKTMDCDKLKETFSMAGGKEQTQVGVAENVEHSNSKGIENKLENNDVAENSIRLSEDKEEEFDPEHGSVSPCRSADASLLDKQNDIPIISKSDTSKFGDSDCCQLGVEDAPDSSPVIACGTDDKSCEEETSQQFVDVGVQERVHEQLPRQVDNQNIHSDINYHQENSDLSGSHLVEGKTSKRARDDLETDEKDGSSSMEEESEPIQKDEANSSSDEDGFTSDVHVEARRRDKTTNKICKDMPSVSGRSKRIKQNHEHGAQSSNIDLSRRSLTRGKTNSSKLHRTNASSKLRKVEKAFIVYLQKSFPQGRRSRLPWTEEEEKMLEEGVQKFSSTPNQKMPWKKILEFGEHVFHNTRNPGDLKVKWRNMVTRVK